MKSVKGAICGETRPFCFSLRVLQDIIDKYESLDNMFAALDSSGVTDIAWLASRMMVAGEKYAKKRGEDCPPALSADEIMDELGADEIVKLKLVIFDTISSDSKADVETDAEENPTKAGE